MTFLTQSSLATNPMEPPGASVAIRYSRYGYLPKYTPSPFPSLACLGGQVNDSNIGDGTLDVSSSHEAAGNIRQVSPKGDGCWWPGACRPRSKRDASLPACLWRNHCLARLGSAKEGMLISRGASSCVADPLVCSPRRHITAHGRSPPRSHTHTHTPSRTHSPHHGRWMGSRRRGPAQGPPRIAEPTLLFFSSFPNAAGEISNTSPIHVSENMELPGLSSRQQIPVALAKISTGEPRLAWSVGAGSECCLGQAVGRGSPEDF
ncbi:hypothetical protein MAPG_00112 [Magnaporthiopsis poae ATCC 64411]|uniref:Uncharacterized protein n=1 Tax=Magnaporthiopsis poae (strain ATCC 64411 / 73-15) TaxID=644358 RepID=A0A0C4DK50_MAGP6|nr:hypothetical protein MAPG_00112 [Magnaporthiopsis poae ATCC 64411]